MNLLIKIIVLSLSSVLFSCSSTNTLTTDTFSVNSTNTASNFSTRNYQVIEGRKVAKEQPRSYFARNTLRAETSTVGALSVGQSNPSAIQNYKADPKARAVKTVHVTRSVQTPQQFTHNQKKQRVAKSMIDRELMISFYQTPTTGDDKLIANIVADDIYYIQNYHTGYESMYVRSTKLRGSTTEDPATVEYKTASLENNARFGLTIARR